MRLSKAAMAFLITKEAEGYSPYTLTGYKRTLKLFKELMGDPDIEDITVLDLRKYLNWLRSEYKPEPPARADRLSEATIDNHYVALKSFFSWAELEFDIERPDGRLARPEYKNPETEPFSREDIKRLLDGCVRDAAGNKRRTRYRDQAVIQLLLDTGVRSGELHRLKIGDVAVLENGTIRINIRPYRSGRKSGSRFVYLGRSSSGALKKYLELVRDKPEREEALFTTKAGMPMAKGTILKLVKRLGERVGIENVYLHRFRHTFAIMYLRNGGDVMTLQRLLGHSSFDMVTRYLKLAEADAENQHIKSSPADKWLRDQTL